VRNRQYAALPYRFDGDGNIEVLLVTSLRTRRWIIPKGWPIKGLKPATSAAREAFEEAGLVGKVAQRPVGRYAYPKLCEKTDRSTDCDVIVFPLLVKRQLTIWPEVGQREAQWLSAEKASKTVADQGLGHVIHAAVDHLRKAAS
jgi:8-oxo-dGTP pyrophosphatase MutT (NUDIX family)